MFCEILLPENVSGRLYRHSMPARRESWEEFEKEAKRCEINVIVCLTSDEEIEEKSPAYAAAVKRGMFAIRRECFPIRDYHVPAPSREKDFVDLVRLAADLLRAGENILVHCGAGVGRTGIFLICLLMALGLAREEASNRVKKAGAEPENKAQESFVSRCEREFCSSGRIVC